MLMLVAARVFRAGGLFVRLEAGMRARSVLSPIRHPLSASLSTHSTSHAQ
jgi:hypothetical protein